MNIFTQDKYEKLLPSGYFVEVPNIKSTELELISVDDDDYVTVMNEYGEIREDLQLPNKEHWSDLVDGVK
jgi:translation initiation factor 5A